VKVLVSWNWHPDFPEDCPPEQSSAANGTYYRIVKNVPPDASDFISAYHQNQKRAIRELKSGRRTHCEVQGLSVYADKMDAIECALQYPKIGDKIAGLLLAPQSGKILHTSGGFESHNTWWKERDYNPLNAVIEVNSL